MGNRAMSQDLMILGNHIRDRRKEMHISQETLRRGQRSAPTQSVVLSVVSLLCP